MTRRWFLASSGVALTALAPVFAQEGHPLTGTWHGSWKPSGANGQPIDVTFVMFWDGKTVNGTINPGFEGIKMENTSLEGKGWLVHIEGNSKDGRIIIDGTIENVTNARRSITGTWKQGARSGDFKVVRDN